MQDGHHTFVLNSNGRVQCWGEAEKGALGNGSSSGVFANPVEVSNVSDAAEMTVFLKHGCILDSQGAHWCWGNNDAGQLGVASKTNALAPVLVQWPSE
jgi:alpha-tubulin suppressor-like RCC1 family protein